MPSSTPAAAAAAAAKAPTVQQQAQNAPAPAPAPARPAAPPVDINDDFPEGRDLPLPSRLRNASTASLPCNIATLAFGCDCPLSSPDIDSGCLFDRRQRRRHHNHSRSSSNGSSEDEWKENRNCALRVAVIGDSHVIGFDPVSDAFSHDGFGAALTERIHYNLRRCAKAKRRKFKSKKSNNRSHNSSNISSDDVSPTSTRVRTRTFARGMSGLTAAAMVPYYKTPEFRRALAWRPHIVVMMFGTNEAQVPKRQRHLYYDEATGRRRRTNSTISTNSTATARVFPPFDQHVQLLQTSYLHLLRAFADPPPLRRQSSSTARDGAGGLGPATRRFIIVTPPPVLPSCARGTPYCYGIDGAVLRDRVVPMLKNLRIFQNRVLKGAVVQVVDTHSWIQDSQLSPAFVSTLSDAQRASLLAAWFRPDGLHLTAAASELVAVNAVQSVCQIATEVNKALSWKRWMAAQQKKKSEQAGGDAKSTQKKQQQDLEVAFEEKKYKNILGAVQHFMNEQKCEFLL